MANAIGNRRDGGSERLCVAPIGPITQALYAREILARHGVPVTVVRNDPAAVFNDWYSGTMGYVVEFGIGE